MQRYWPLLSCCSCSLQRERVESNSRSLCHRTRALEHCLVYLAMHCRGRECLYHKMHACSKIPSLRCSCPIHQPPLNPTGKIAHYSAVLCRVSAQAHPNYSQARDKGPKRATRTPAVLAQATESAIVRCAAQVRRVDCCRRFATFGD